MAKHNPFAAIARGHDLAEAIVDALREPLLVLDPDLRVIAASRSFYQMPLWIETPGCAKIGAWIWK